jgi:alpha-tubulin suppressor-like RCC1 family protein
MKTFWTLLILLMMSVGCQDTNDEKVREVFGEKDNDALPQEVPNIKINLFKITPQQIYLDLNATHQFTANGGREPYSFVIQNGAGSITSNGLYTAPAAATDATVMAIDADGETAFAIVNVAAALTLGPSGITLGPNQPQTFSASGGFPPYTYTLIAGGGSMDSVSGDFISPGVASAILVKVTDNFGNEAFASASVTSDLSVTPIDPTVALNEAISISAFGGIPPYTFTKLTGIGDLTSNVFTADTTMGTALVRIEDSLGTFKDITITVADKPKFVNNAIKMPISETVQLNVNGGVGPYTYIKTSGSADASVDGTGLFTSGATMQPASVRVVDSNGYYDDVTISIHKPHEIQSGGQYNCIKKWNTETDYEYRCWGWNSYPTNYSGPLMSGITNKGDAKGEMGDNIDVVPLPSGKTPLKVYTGTYHTCALLDDYSLACWGYNSNGVLGIGNTSYPGRVFGEMGDNTPLVLLGSGRTIHNTLPLKAVYTGANTHACAILDTSEVRCWGANTYGQLGLGDVAIRCDSAANCGDNLPNVNLGGIDAIQVTTGPYHSCALLTNGEVKCWGYNLYGQLGLGDTTNRGNAIGTIPSANTAIDLGTGLTAKEIQSGDHFVCAILNDDTIKCWGRNNYGQLGIGDNLNRGDDPGEMGDALPRVDLGGRLALSLEGGSDFMCALLSDGEYYCWGLGSSGQLANGDGDNVGDVPGEMGLSLLPINTGFANSPKKISGYTATNCAITQSDDLKCFGSNLYGTLGQEHDYNMGASLLTVGDAMDNIDVGHGDKVKDVATGYTHVCIITMGDQVKCWGHSAYGSLGDGKAAIGTHPDHLGKYHTLPIGDDTSGLAELVVGRNNAVMMYNDQRFKIWGSNIEYQINPTALLMGEGSRTPIGYRENHILENIPYFNLGTVSPVKQISMGDSHICSLHDNGRVKCWGHNEYGENFIGSGADNPITSPSHFGDNLSFIDLGTSAPVKQLVDGYISTCALWNNDNVKCWGANRFGSSGEGLANIDIGDAPGELGTARPYIALPKDGGIDYIVGGIYSHCALYNNDNIRCWGYGSSGLNGIGSGAHLGDNPGEMAALTPILLRGDAASVNVKKLVLKGYHACVLWDDYKAKCWGRNSNGQLGLGDLGTRGDAVGEMGDTLPFVKLGTNEKIMDVSVGYEHSCFVLFDNTVKCVGRNDIGQLGTGNKIQYGSSASLIEGNIPKLEFE